MVDLLGNPKLFQLALDAGGVGCWVWDAQTDSLTGDAQVASCTAPGPYAIASYLDLIHADDRATWSSQWTRAIDPQSDGQFGCEYRLIRPDDGRTVWIASFGRTEIKNGKVVRVVGVLRDVTERRDAEAALQETASRYTGIVSIASDAIISMDEAQAITMFNDGAELIFGYTREEIIGKPLTVLLPERYRGSHGDHVRTFGQAAVQARRMGQRSEILGQRKNGETFHAEASISKIDVGSRRFFTAVLRDITERKQSQALLERRIEEATRDLRLEMQRREESQAQLVRTQRMEAFGQLTGGVAHDFNNLLTVIMGNLELLDMRLGDEKAKILLHRAQDAAEMGARLTSRLLTFARRRSFTASPLDLNEVVVGMAELLERSLGEQITLTTSLEHTPWTVVADPSEVENAILNLAINARDAMPHGGKLIIETANMTFDEARVDAGTRIDAGQYVRLSATDTGVGMAQDIVRKAFEPFFTTKETGKGTGLGLSTIYGFVRQAGGVVTIYSEVGCGTTVNLYLPRAELERGRDAGGKAHTSVASAAGERILLVEDDADVRAVTEAQFEALGYAVTAVASGPEAVSVLSLGAAFDLIFSDVVMPGGMSGFDLARWVATHVPNLKIILASGYPDAALNTEPSEGNRPDILKKPFNRSELARALRRVLDSNVG